MTAPAVSIVIPAFHSEATLGGCLESIAGQSFADFEVVLVDSTPEAKSEAILKDWFPDRSILIRPAFRLFPQAARNRGAGQASGRLLVFTDPDIYPSRNWLEMLIKKHRACGPVVFGPIYCFGARWMDLGVHLTKFHICLPGRAVREVLLGWSGNFLIERSLFDKMGGFPERFQGDSGLTARMRRAGIELAFEPQAVVYHDHQGVTLGGFLRERMDRGMEFGKMNALGELLSQPWTPLQMGLHALGALLLPFQIFQGCAVIGGDARRSGLLSQFFRCLPIIVMGRSAWGLGAKLAYLSLLKDWCVDPTRVRNELRR